MHMIEFAYIFRKWIDIMLDLNLHGGTVEDSENAEEFFLGPSTLVEGGAVLLWEVRMRSPNDTVSYCCSS